MIDFITIAPSRQSTHIFISWWLWAEYITVAGIPLSATMQRMQSQNDQRAVHQLYMHWFKIHVTPTRWWRSKQDEFIDMSRYISRNTAENVKEAFGGCPPGCLRFFSQSAQWPSIYHFYLRHSLRWGDTFLIEHGAIPSNEKDAVRLWKSWSKHHLLQRSPGTTCRTQLLISFHSIAESQITRSFDRDVYKCNLQIDVIFCSNLQNPMLS